MIRKAFEGKNFMRLASGVAVDAELQEIIENSDLFAGSTFRQSFKDSPFKDTETIPCRLSYDSDVPLTEEEMVQRLKTVGIVNKQAVDTEFYGHFPRVYDKVMALSSLIKAEQIGRVLIAKLKAGGAIKPHVDFGEYHDYYDRFHIVLSGKGCMFRSGNEWAHMLPGEIWWFRNSEEHEVTNNTDEDRIHIIMDFKLRGDKQ